MMKKYIWIACLFWACGLVSAQLMLPAYQGVFSKPVANANAIKPASDSTAATILVAKPVGFTLP
jgi:hypothetical protein